MTPEFIALCERAKEEGWLKWEPEFGDWCLYRNGIGLVIEEGNLLLLEFKSQYKTGWYPFDDCTWLPTEGQLVKILRNLDPVVNFYIGCAKDVYSLEVSRTDGGVALFLGKDLSLALLKAVEAVGRKP